jgi:hypothetical protein
MRGAVPCVENDRGRDLLFLREFRACKSQHIRSKQFASSLTMAMRKKELLAGTLMVF